MLRAVRLACVVGAVAAASAQAKLCGDDVGGRDVPCACGDVVVSDLRLGPDDPVTSAACPGDGLVVRARSDAPDGLRIDLRGQTLLGSGRGRGLWVVAGGPGGARVESSGGPAYVTGFAEGIVAVGQDALVSARGLRIERPRRTGVRVHGHGWSLVDVWVADAGGDGFALGGTDFHVDGTRALRSRGSGYAVAGRKGLLGASARVEAEGNGGDGIALTGRGHRVERCAVSTSGRRDVRLAAGDVVAAGCAAVRVRPERGGRRR